MHISIAPELEKFVHSKVSSGGYQSTDDVFSEAILSLIEMDQLKQARLKKLNLEIQIGIDQAERGELISSDDLVKEMQAFKNNYFDKQKW